MHAKRERQKGGEEKVTTDLSPEEEGEETDEKETEEGGRWIREMTMETGSWVGTPLLPAARSMAWKTDLNGKGARQGVLLPPNGHMSSSPGFPPVSTSSCLAGLGPPSSRAGPLG